MSKNNNKERKCKICGKTIVGKNKTGVCSACKKKTGDTGVTSDSIRHSRINRRRYLDSSKNLYKKIIINNLTRHTITLTIHTIAPTRHTITRLNTR